MRRLVWLTVFFAILWSGWWVFAAYSLQASFVGWFAERRSEGWQADIAQTHRSGFPLALEISLVSPALADPETGVALSASQLDFSAPAWRPGHLTLRLPPDEITLATPEQSRSIVAQSAVADMQVRAGASLELQGLQFVSGAWSVSEPEGQLMSAKGLTLQMQQNMDAPSRYDVGFEVPSFQPGAVPRQRLLVPDDWPVAFDSVTFDASVSFDRPLDLRVLEVARPQVRRIDLRLVEVAWGDLQFRGTAQLDVAADGVPTGDLSLQARNWQKMLSAIERTGTLPAAFVPQIEAVLRTLARGSGNADTIDLTLTFKNDLVYLGFIPVGKAPRIMLR